MDPIDVDSRKACASQWASCDFSPQEDECSVESSKKKKEETEQVNEIYQIFQLIDSNSMGIVNQEQLLAFMRTLGQKITEAEFQDIFAAADVDENAVVDFDEFCALISARIKPGEIKNDMEDIFHAFDIRNCGSFTAEDLVQVTANIADPFTESDAEKLLQALGVDPYASVSVKSRFYLILSNLFIHAEFMRLFDIQEDDGTGAFHNLLCHLSANYSSSSVTIDK
ncbi:hypothetical protein Ciccas_007299 [Cichlidogyrus casuarinus]|uniref:EF-hand domain-containing protein n=1 Tax=Cichlidogyrus casuarinus TaxID=1844966 RepID=A0ABD2Q3A2_9PLAT